MKQHFLAAGAVVHATAEVLQVPFAQAGCSNGGQMLSQLLQSICMIGAGTVQTADNKHDDWSAAASSTRTNSMNAIVVKSLDWR